MLLVFLFLCLMFVIIGIVFSKIKIEIRGNIDNLLHNINKEKIEKKIISVPKINYEIDIKVYLYNCDYLGFLKLSINSEYLKIYKYKISIRKLYIELLENFDIEKIIKSFKIKDLKLLKINIEQILINGKMKTLNDIVTMHLVSAALVLLYNLVGYLSFKVKNEIKKVDIEIEPIFSSNSINMFIKEKTELINGYITYKVITDMKFLNLLRVLLIISKNMKKQNV